MRILDTLEFARRLQEAGITREHAEAHATVMTEMILVEVATKPDIEQATATLRAELKAVERDLRTEIASLRQELSRLASDIGTRLDRMQDKLTIRMGAMLLAGIAALATLQKLL
ncbi:MAG: hypothetical protein FJX65_03830 [Alphaproteobacteria bacterium]|nr:hypothetical protein [Alphaproteobacteria bacterium]